MSEAAVRARVALTAAFLLAVRFFAVLANDTVLESESTIKRAKNREHRGKGVISRSDPNRITFQRILPLCPLIHFEHRMFSPIVQEHTFRSQESNRQDYD